GRAVARLGLAGDVADRLVQQDRDPGDLLLAGGRRDLDAGVGRHPGAQYVHDLAIDPDPAVGDPGVRLAPRTEPEFAHSLRKSGMIHRVRMRCAKRSSLSEPAGTPGPRPARGKTH